MEEMLHDQILHIRFSNPVLEDPQTVHALSQLPARPYTQSYRVPGGEKNRALLRTGLGNTAILHWLVSSGRMTPYCNGRNCTWCR